MTMHTIKRFLLLSFIASCTFPHILHGMYIYKSPVARKIERVQRARRQHIPVEITIPDVIVKKSQYIKNLSETFSEPAGPNTDKKITDKKITDKKITDKKITLKPSDVSQETVNFLEDLYDPRATNSNLKSNSLDTLIKAINAETFLEMGKRIETISESTGQVNERKTVFKPTKIYQSLKTAALNKILQEPLTPTSINALQKLYPEAAKEIINDLVQETKIDTRLLGNYQKKLEKRPAQFSMPTNILGFSPTNKILFFNKDKIVYSSSLDGKNEICVVERKNQNNKKPFSFQSSAAEIFCNPNGSLCLLRPYNDFELLNLETQTIIKTNIDLPNKEQGCWRFASNDTLCIIDTQGNVSLLNLLDNNKNIKIKQSFQIIFNQNETINGMTCKINNNEITKLVVSTSDDRIYLYNKNTNPGTFILPPEKAISLYYDRPQICFNNAATTAYMIRRISHGNHNYSNKLFSIDLYGDSPSLNEIAKLSLSTFAATHLTISNDDKLLAAFPMSANMKIYHETTPNFILAKTKHTWQSEEIDNDCTAVAISEDGKESIEQCSGILSNSYSFVTLYNDNMAAAIDYFDTSKMYENYTEQQRLLGAYLMHIILNQHNLSQFSQYTTLDETEAKIYQTCLPQEIKTMLTKTINLRLPTNSEQINQIAVTNLKDEDYSSAIPAATTKTDTSSLMNKLSTWYDYYMGKKQ